MRCERDEVLDEALEKAVTMMCFPFFTVMVHIYYAVSLCGYPKMRLKRQNTTLSKVFFEPQRENIVQGELF